MNLIAAVDRKWGIGRNGRLLVSIPSDRKLFQEETTGKVIVMGRKTLETLPNKMPLPNRVNVILSGKPDFQAKGAVVTHSMEETLSLLTAYPPDDIFIIGGAQIYRAFLPYCDTAHVTYIDYEYEADAYFPNLDRQKDWKLCIESEEQTYFDIEYYFRMYRRTNRTAWERTNERR